MTKQDLNTRSQQLEGSQGEVEQLTQLKAQHADTISQLEGELATTQEKLSTTQQNLDTRSQELEGSQGEVEQLTQLKAQHEDKISHLEGELATTQQDLSTTQQNLDTRSQELEGSQQTIDEQGKELGTRASIIIEKECANRSLVTTVNFAISRWGAQQMVVDSVRHERQEFGDEVVRLRKQVALCKTKQAQLEVKVEAADRLLGHDIPHSFANFDDRIEKLNGQHHHIKCRYDKNLELWKKALQIKSEVGCHSVNPLSLCYYLLFGIRASFSMLLLILSHDPILTL